MTPRLAYEAARCTDPVCGATVVRKIEKAPVLYDGQACPVCDAPLSVIKNQTIIAQIVLATKAGA
jgi:hypothetical protein